MGKDLLYINGVDIQPEYIASTQSKQPSQTIDAIVANLDDELVKCARAEIQRVVSELNDPEKTSVEFRQQMARLETTRVPLAMGFEVKKGAITKLDAMPLKDSSGKDVPKETVVSLTTPAEHENYTRTLNAALQRKQLQQAHKVASSYNELSRSGDVNDRSKITRDGSTCNIDVLAGKGNSGGADQKAFNYVDKCQTAAQTSNGKLYPMRLQSGKIQNAMSAKLADLNATRQDQVEHAKKATPVVGQMMREKPDQGETDMAHVGLQGKEAISQCISLTLSAVSKEAMRTYHELFDAWVDSDGKTKVSAQKDTPLVLGPRVMELVCQKLGIPVPGNDPQAELDRSLAVIKTRFAYDEDIQERIQARKKEAKPEGETEGESDNKKAEQAAEDYDDLDLEYAELIPKKTWKKVGKTTSETEKMNDEEKEEYKSDLEDKIFIAQMKYLYTHDTKENVAALCIGPEHKNAFSALDAAAKEKRKTDIYERFVAEYTQVSGLTEPEDKESAPAGATATEEEAEGSEGAGPAAETATEGGSSKRPRDELLEGILDGGKPTKPPTKKRRS